MARRKAHCNRMIRFPVARRLNRMPSLGSHFWLRFSGATSLSGIQEHLSNERRAEPETFGLHGGDQRLNGVNDSPPLRHTHDSKRPNRSNPDGFGKLAPSVFIHKARAIQMSSQRYRFDFPLPQFSRTRRQNWKVAIRNFDPHPSLHRPHRLPRRPPFATPRSQLAMNGRGDKYLSKLKSQQIKPLYGRQCDQSRGVSNGDHDGKVCVFPAQNGSNGLPLDQTDHAATRCAEKTSGLNAGLRRLQ